MQSSLYIQGIIPYNIPLRNSLQSFLQTKKTRFKKLICLRTHRSSWWVEYEYQNQTSGSGVSLLFLPLSTAFISTNVPQNNDGGSESTGPWDPVELSDLNPWGQSDQNGDFLPSWSCIKSHYFSIILSPSFLYSPDHFNMLFAIHSGRVITQIHIYIYHIYVCVCAEYFKKLQNLSGAKWR